MKAKEILSLLASNPAYGRLVHEYEVSSDLLRATGQRWQDKQSGSEVILVPWSESTQKDRCREKGLLCGKHKAFYVGPEVGPYIKVTTDGERWSLASTDLFTPEQLRKAASFLLDTAETLEKKQVMV